MTNLILTRLYQYEEPEYSRWVTGHPFSIKSVTAYAPAARSGLPVNPLPFTIQSDTWQHDLIRLATDARLSRSFAVWL